MADERSEGVEEQHDREDSARPAAEREGKRVVTYEAADRGAVCCLGCQAWVMIFAGAGFGAWYLLQGDLWRIIVGLILFIGGTALARYVTAGRNRWEVSFDRDRRVITLLTRIGGTTERREIPYEDVEAVVLQTITRDVTGGDDVPHHVPVFRLSSGERVVLDERLSIKDPDRAEEVLAEMRTLLGLNGEHRPHGSA
ncbi:MAG: hypothetical protein ACOX9R_17465 [Armatimonadota bacterium]|jgi:hypothetical protein